MEKLPVQLRLNFPDMDPISGPLVYLPPERKTFFAPGEWIFIGGMGLTFILTCVVIYKGTGVEALGVFGSVVLGHGASSVWANRQKDQL